MTAQSPVRDPATAEFSFSDLRPTDVLAASRRIAELVRRTPLVRSAPLSDLAGGDVYLKLGNIRFRRQDRDEAVRCWERALELDPDNAIVRTNLESVRQVLG